jgi:hypothetical protein
LSALTFDPWVAARKSNTDEAPPPNPPKSPNPLLPGQPKPPGLGGLGDLGGGASSEYKTTTQPLEPRGTADGLPPPRPDVTLPTVPVADLVEQMAEAMAANPVYRITNLETAMEYFRGVARNRLAAASRGLP